MDYIQTQVIRRVYEKTNNTHQIGKQSEDELIIVMRSIYLQHSKNMKDRIDEQINILIAGVVSIILSVIIYMFTKNNSVSYKNLLFGLCIQ